MRSDTGAKARFYHAVCQGQLGQSIKVDMKAELFSRTQVFQSIEKRPARGGPLLFCGLSTTAGIVNI